MHDVKQKNFIINTKFVDEFSREIYEQTYKYGEEDINSTQLRVAVDLASIEKDKDRWSQEFLWALEDFKFVPGGRITSNAGTKLKGTTYINCFVPGTQVLTDKGYINIEDVVVGDSVLTHLGRWKKVRSTMSREYEGNVDVYMSSVLSGDIKSTEEHPFYQGDNKWEVSKNNKKLVILNYKNEEDEYVKLDILPIVKNIKRIDNKEVDIFSNDEEIYTSYKFDFYNGSVTTKESKSINRKLKLDVNVAYAFGRFVGDGSTFSGAKIYEVDGFNIIFSKKERSELLFIKESLENAFGLDININESNDFDGIYLRKRNPLIAEFLKESFGRNSYTKKIPDFIWMSPKNIIESFLLGVFDADGTVTKKGELRITLSNEKLVKDIQALMNMIGYPGRLTETSSDGFKSWKLYIDQYIGENFIKKLNKYYDDDRLDIHPVNNGLSPIINESKNGEKIHTIKGFKKSSNFYKGRVYNISVDEDESYVVNNVVVHNCFVDGFIGKDQDSMEGILDALRRQALILKSEGGYGFCSDVMRPRGSFIGGIGNESPGSVKMLDMWDTQSSVITEGSGNKTKKKEGKVKIRKGAQMVTMSCFSDSTEILTNEGWINVVDIIDRINNGDKIYAIDDDGLENLILNPIVREPEPVYKIETEDGNFIEVTADHEFEVKNIKTGEVYLKPINKVDPENEILKLIYI